MESDVKITLPRDAEGREIPLDTNVLYNADGNKMYVKRVDFGSFSREWMFRLIEIDGGILRTRALYPEQVYLENPVTPDSWDKLLEDLDHVSKGGDDAECLYARRDGMEAQCTGCRLEDVESDDIECPYLAYADIAARIRKLRGEE